MIQLIVRHYKKIIFITVVLVAAGILVIPRLKIETDIVKQMPKDNKVFETFRKVVEDVGTMDLFLIVVRLPEDAALDRYFPYVEMLAENINELETIKNVEYRLPDPMGYYRMLLPHVMGMTDEDEWEGIMDRLSEREIKRQLSLAKSRLQTPLSGTVKSWIRSDPLNFLEIFQDRFLQTSQGFSLDFSTGYYLSRDHKFLIILAAPVRPAQDIVFAREIVQQVRRVEEETLKEFRSESSDPDFSVHLEYGGGYVVALEDGSLVKGDMIRNMSTSFVGVLVLFLFAFRRFGSLIFASLPVIVGMVFTFAVATLVFHEVNAASSAFAALLIGLAIDFIIVSYARYIEERQRGLSCLDACRVLRRVCYPPIVVGAITTAATFSSFYITTLPGLQELGLLTSIGILICMVTVFVLLPTMFAADAGSRRSEKLYLHSFGSDHIVKYAIRHAGSVLVVSLVVTVICIILAVGIPFIDDANTMRSPTNRGVLLRKELSESFGTNFSPMMILVQARSGEELIEKNSQIQSFLDRISERNIISSHNGIYRFLPSVHWQEDNIRKRSESLPDKFIQNVSAAFQEACRDLQLNPEVFAPFLNDLKQALVHPRPITLASVPENDMLVSRFIHNTGDLYESVVSVYPPSGRWRREPPPRLENWVRAHGPGITLTGVNVLSREIRTIARRDAFRATALGFFLVFLLLYMNFKKLRYTLFSLIPLFFGIVWMLGTMRMLKIPLNSMNIFVIAMIIGIGVDYGIHVMHRYLEGVGNPWENVARTGNAILVAALSTMVGFGTLTMSHFPGLRSMGLLAILGAAYCALASLTIFPVFIKISRMRSQGAGTKSPDG